MYLFRRRWPAKFDTICVVAIAIIVCWILIALFAPLIAPYRETKMISGQGYSPISWANIFGTDQLGRDVLTRVIYGARLSIALALASTTVAALWGITLGFAASLLGPIFDGIVSRINDIFLSIPSLMLALIVISALGTSPLILIFTIGFIESVRLFRIARALGFNIVSLDYVVIARARGENMWWILFNEILPNTIGPLATDFGLRFTYSILLLSSLSFLGLGVQPPSADLGSMVKESIGGLASGSPAVLVPAAAIFSIAVGVNLLVDWSLSRSHREISVELLK